MARPQLTEGICERLSNSENEPNSEALFTSQPTLQLLSFKKVPPSGGNNSIDRYRVIVSDGKYFLQSMLATQLNHLVEEEVILKGAIVVIEKFTCNIVQGKRYVRFVTRHVAVHLTYTHCQAPYYPRAACLGEGRREDW